MRRRWLSNQAHAQAVGVGFAIHNGGTDLHTTPPDRSSLHQVRPTSSGFSSPISSACLPKNCTVRTHQP